MIARKVAHNVFGCPLSSELELEHFERKGQSQRFHTSGVWLLASKINHSCHNNCMRSFIGDFQIVRATHDLPAGSELGFRYLDNDGLVDHDQLTSTWGFTCTCDICEERTSLSKSKRNLRKNLLEDLARLITERSIDTKRLDSLIETIGKTYGDPATKVPRLELANLCFKISGALSHTSDLDTPLKVLLFTIKALQSFGFIIDVKNSSNDEQSFNPFIISRWGIVNVRVFEALSCLAETSGEFREYMGTAYQILFGMPYSDQASGSRKIPSRR